MNAPKPQTVTLPASAVADLYVFLDRAAGADDPRDVLVEMAGYLRAALDRATGGQS